MKKSNQIIQNIISFIGHSNIFVAICVYALTAQTISIFGDSKSQTLAFFNAASTFVIYNAQRLFQYLTKQTMLDYRKQWFNKNHKLLFLLVFICCIYLIYAALYEITPLVPFYATLCVISLLYFIPGINIRKTPYLKIFIIGFVWALVYCYIPNHVQTTSNGSIQFYLSDFETNKVLYSFSQFLFISAICIPFDIRDLDLDKKKEMVTFPIGIGIEKSKQVAYLLILIYFIIGCIIKSDSSNLILAYGITSISTIILVHKSSENSHPYFYIYLVEGLTLLQYLVFLITKH